MRLSGNNFLNADGIFSEIFTEGTKTQKIAQQLSSLTLARFRFFVLQWDTKFPREYMVYPKNNLFGVQNILGYYVQGYKNADANPMTPGSAQL